MNAIFNNIAITITEHSSYTLNEIKISKNREVIKFKKILILLSKQNNVSFNYLSKELDISRQACSQLYDDISHQNKHYKDIKDLVDTLSASINLLACK